MFSEEVTINPSYFVPATGTGPWGGENMIDAVSTVRGELGAPHISFLPDLAQRGFASGALARTIACLDGLSADCASFGWRLTGGFSREGETASGLFASDINVLADVVGQESAPGNALKVQLIGPISLAASLYLHNGERAVADAGARRDIRDSFLWGIGGWLSLIREATPAEEIIIQLNEPMLEAALKGEIRTVSGLRTLRSLSETEVAESYRQTSTIMKKLGVTTILSHHMPDIPTELARCFSALSYNFRRCSTEDWETIAAHLEADMNIQFAAVDPLRVRSVSDTARDFWQIWRTIGLPASRLRQVTLTELPGLEKLNRKQSMLCLTALTDTAHALSEVAQENG